MATNYNPKTITDGLVVYIDPGNIKSYPGSGDTFNDLTSNGLNISGDTLNTATDAKAGTIYDHSNGYFTETGTFTPISSLTWSIVWWVRSTGTTPSNYRAQIRLRDTNADTGSAYPGYYWQSDTRQTTNSYILNYQKQWNGTDAVSSWYTRSHMNSTAWATQEWFCCGVSHNKSVGSNGVYRSYTNGSFIGSNTQTRDVSGYGDINRLLLNTSGNNTVYMGPVALYNRVLTDLEFKQIFDTHKTRFGY